MVTDQQKEELYHTYHGRVFGYIVSRINNRQNAEDLASDVFVKIYEKIDRFDGGKASLSTWIYTITRNTLTDYYRTRRVLDELPEEQDDDTSVEDEVCTEEMLETLARALETLEERERDIVVLRFYAGMMLKDIAARMDISYTYVKVLQNNAFKKLKNFFENQ